MCLALVVLRKQQLRHFLPQGRRLLRLLYRLRLLLSFKSYQTIPPRFSGQASKALTSMLRVFGIRLLSCKSCRTILALSTKRAFKVPMSGFLFGTSFSSNRSSPSIQALSSDSILTPRLCRWVKGCFS